MDDFKDRIEKVEDTLAFCERTQDELSEQLIKAFEALESLSRRISALEGRMHSIEAPVTDPDSEPADD